MSNPQTLYYREYGQYRSDSPTLILLHGLLGSSANWHSIARQLGEQWHLIVPDLRNHGRSPHHDDASYEALRDDVVELIDEHGLDRAVLIGHSMGGKTAMLTALTHGDLVEALVVVDIAPVNYHNRFGTILEALQAIDLAALRDRNQADEILARYLPERSLRQYLLQNLASEKGRWQWRINLQAICRDMGKIIAFPKLSEGLKYSGKTLFLYGGDSDYVRPGHEADIRLRFPNAQLRCIPGAGHWLYAEKPTEFLQALQQFLASLGR